MSWLGDGVDDDTTIWHEAFSARPRTTVDCEVLSVVLGQKRRDNREGCVARPGNLRLGELHRQNKIRGD